MSVRIRVAREDEIPEVAELQALFLREHAEACDREFYATDEAATKRWMTWARERMDDGGFCLPGIAKAPNAVWC